MSSFLIKYFCICCCKISQTVTKFNVVFFKIIRFDSIVLCKLFLKIILIICFILTFLTITKYNVISSDIFSTDCFLLSFNIVLWIFIFKLRLISCCINIILISNWKIVSSCVFISLLKPDSFILRILCSVLWFLTVFLIKNYVLC